jgi:streptomycin 6-kinase
MTDRIAAFIGRRWNVPAEDFRVEVRPLRGGLESTVARALIFPRSRPSALPAQLVIKTLRADQAREGAIYETLWRHLDTPPAIRVLGRDSDGQNTYLFLEHARRLSSWPWSNTNHAAAVCRELARFHERRELPVEAFAWDYEGELALSAAGTLAIATTARDAFGNRYWCRLGDLTRVVAARSQIRERLLATETTVLHGDVHPGNVILRAGRRGTRVVLIDWARARIGSPMEDVASWLHALGCWEPEARRRHDTLIREYLAARRTPRTFSTDVRTTYWLASASNGLSGAIRYHLAVLADPASAPAARYDSHRALVAWTRVIRRVAALLSTNPGR